MSDSTEQIFEAMVRGGMTPKSAYDGLRSIAGEAAAKAVLARYEEKVGRIRVLTDPITFTNDKVLGWYAGPNAGDRFWPALQAYLLEEKGWSSDAVETIDNTTTKILSLMQPPGLGRVDTKGLVVGYVQSGKTANYTALIAKAADVGYRLFIVLSGVHNSLRRQTEKRLRDELVNLNNHYWATLTSLEEDFKASAGGNTNAFLSDVSHLKILCVVKKNATVLRRLLKWLGLGDASVLASCPVLIIDDEADQAGLNAARDPNSRTVINRRILELMALLPKVAYVGYTATPFANVLVDPSGSDLYPSSFIAALPHPKAYFGAETLFGREILDDDHPGFESQGLDMIRSVPAAEVDDLRPKSVKTRGTFEPHITKSLQDALDYFLLACAARRVRGSTDHASMLIHTTLYADPHEAIAAQVEAYRKIRQAELTKRKASVLARLRELWESEAPRVPASNWGNPEHSFDDLAPHLVDVSRETAIIVENATSLSRLMFGDEARIQIAIGGNTLSRGLTLEGLLVSFFVRSATAYDTLLQMGRWFGYRFGYEDLPRIWMTDELRDAFFMLATVEQELRNDISRYDAESLTPKEFGVRIRTHPGLAITSPLKMQSAVDCNVSYSGAVTQTRFFKHQDAAWLRRNLRATRQLLAAAGTPEVVAPHRVYRDVPASEILAFLERYEVHEHHPVLDRKTLCGYIQAQNDKRALTHWNVVLVQKKSTESDLGKVDLGEGLQVNPVSRTQIEQSDPNKANLGTIATQGYFVADLEPERRTSNKKIPRTDRDRPLLVLIPIAKHSTTTSPGRAEGSDTPSKASPINRRPLDAVEHIMGIALWFPNAKDPTPQKYVTVDPAKLPYVDQEDEYEDEEAAEP